MHSAYGETATAPAASGGVSTPEDTLAVRLDVSPSNLMALCSGVDIEGAISSRTRRKIEFFDAAESTLHITFEEAPEGVTAALEFEGVSGADRQRIDAPSCDDAVAALSIVAATWLESEPHAEPPAPAAAPIRPSVLPETWPNEDDTDGSSTPTESPFRVGAHIGLNSGLASSAVAAAQVSASRRLGAYTELRLGVRGATVKQKEAKGNATAFWLTAPFDACVSTEMAPSLAISFCGRAEPGFARVDYDGQSHLLPWLGIGPGARLQWSAPQLAVEIEAFAPVQVLGYEIVSDGASIKPFRAISGAFAIGFMMPIP